MYENQYSYSACVVGHALVNKLRQLPWQLFNTAHGWAIFAYYIMVFKSWRLRATKRIRIRCILKSFHPGNHFQKFAVTAFADTNKSECV